LSDILKKQAKRRIEIYAQVCDQTKSPEMLTHRHLGRLWQEFLDDTDSCIFRVQCDNKSDMESSGERGPEILAITDKRWELSLKSGHMSFVKYELEVLETAGVIQTINSAEASQSRHTMVGVNMPRSIKGTHSLSARGQRVHDAVGLLQTKSAGSVVRPGESLSENLPEGPPGITP
jgi:hypothetical protein